MDQAVCDSPIISPVETRSTIGDPYSLLFHFTLEQYQRLIEIGILDEGAPCELLDGMIIHKNRADQGENEMTHGPGHANCVAKLNLLLVRIADQLGLTVRCQLPLQLSPQDAPEPDFALIKPLPADAFHRHPLADEVALVIEVASSSLKLDRNEKQSVYAKAGIPEYWIINLVAKQLEVFRNPDIQRGRYQPPRNLIAGEQIEIKGIAGKTMTLQVADLV